MDIEKMFREAAQAGRVQEEDNKASASSVDTFSNLLTTIGNFRKEQKQDPCVLFGDLLDASRKYMAFRMKDTTKLEKVETAFMAAFMAISLAAATNSSDDEGAKALQEFMENCQALCIYLLDKEQSTTEERQLLFAYVLVGQDMMNQMK